jgi:hypothetical protein
VRGLDEPVFYANQLRDADEPFSDSFVSEMLTLFGRGDWRTITSSTNASLLQQLYFLNRDQMVLATHASDPNSTTNRVIRVFADAQSDQDAIRRMFLATLSRPPTDAETATVMGLRGGRPRPDWLSDLQWSLLNKSDFWFNY